MARRLVAPLSVAARRIVARPGSVLLTGLGIALATAGLTTLLVSQVVVRDRAVADAIGRLPTEQHVLSVSWVGMGTDGWADLDREARSGLAGLRVGDPFRAVAFRTTQFGTEVVGLAAVDEPDRLLATVSGRLPATCSRARCELVALDAGRSPLPTRGLPVVGSATAAPGAPLESLVGSTSSGQRILVGAGVEELARRPEVSGLFRTLTWAVPLDLDRLDSEKAAGLGRQVAELDTHLRRVSPEFAVRAPLDDLASATERAERASRHQLIVGGQCVVVFLAFAVLAASRLRRSAQETSFRLQRLRALRWQVGVEALAYAVMAVVPAMAIGLLGGLAAGAAVASVAGRPAGEAVGGALSEPGVPWALAALALTAVAALVATAAATTLEVRGRGITPLDVAVVAALAAVGAALVLGDTDASTLSQDGDAGISLLGLPVLVALAGGLVAARLLPFVLRVVERGAAIAGTTLRLALLSLVRHPGTAAVAVACLTVTVGMAVFALAYGATLTANQRDAAAYQAPLGYVVAPDPTRGRYSGRTVDLGARLSGAFGVIRRDGEAPTLNRRVELQVLGLPPEAFPDLAWRADYADRPLSDLANSVEYGDEGLQGVDIPRDAVELVLPREIRGDPIRIQAQVRRRDGGFSVLDLKGAPRARSAAAPIPAAARGGTIVGLALGFPPETEFTAAHRATGSRAAPDVFLRGTLTLSALRARTRLGLQELGVDYRNWVSSEGADAGGLESTLVVRYLLTQERTFRLRPRQATDEQPIPVIASASIAAAAGSSGVLPIRVGSAQVDVRVAAIARRFPTLSGDFLVADRVALETAANASVPGAAVADEAWLSSDPDQAPALARRAQFPVRVTSRAAIERSLRADPVSRSASIALLVAAVFAAALALAGLLLTLTVDARDDAAELFDLESLGLDPALLSRHLWLRTTAVLVAGLVGGLATGLLASLLVADVVAVTANATQAEPPIAAVVPWAVLVVGLIVFALTAACLAALFARRQFAGAAPARPEAA